MLHLAKKLLTYLFSLLLVVCGISVSNAGTASSVNASETITIAVASNFAGVMPEIVNRFEAKYGHKVRLSFGSSGKFFAQIKHGAPFQAFFSADQAKAEALIESGLALPESRFTYALGVLALWSKEQDRVDDRGLILTQEQYNTLALANPRFAPYGVAAGEVLQHLNIKQKSEKKWVMGENIAQTYQFVATGNADLGFVALSQIYKKGTLLSGSVWIVPENSYRPICQDAVILQKGKGSEAVLAFMDYMKSDEVKTIVKSYGYRQVNG